jgi:hypothetical protein
MSTLKKLKNIKLTTSTCIFISSALVSISIISTTIAMSEVASTIRHSIWILTNDLDKINKTLAGIEGNISSPKIVGKDALEFIYNSCLEASSVGVSVDASYYSPDRKRHCMNEILKLKIK